MIHIEEIPFQDPLQVCQHFAEDLGTVFLDSATTAFPWSRYTFLAIDPFQILESKNGSVTINQNSIPYSDPFSALKNELKKFILPFKGDLPPFSGGVAGFFSYDLCHHLEALPKCSVDTMHFPDLFLGFYDLVIAWDIRKKSAWISSSGYPEEDTIQRKKRAYRRFQWLKHQLSLLSPLQETGRDVCLPSSIISNFSQRNYELSVEKVLNYIHSGDIFQANISQRFSTVLPKSLTPFQLYRKLRLRNPAPFSSFVHAGGLNIASTSPERFLQLKEGKVETKPIKGTRPKSSDCNLNQLLVEELEKSEKDRAENIMIVDLMRNDLSRVCRPHSVCVPQLCGLESYSTVHHLVSVVQATLQQEYNAVDLLQATFPPGSITGAPKIRAMEIIDEIEPVVRGPYCGNIGYIGFDGNMDTSIVIRSYVIQQRQVVFQAGGAIVADSDPRKEYEETWAKIRPLYETLTER